MFPKEQFTKFFRLVTMSGSGNQMDRINARLDMPKFVAETGRDKCNEMWKLIENGVTPATLKIEEQ